MATSTATNYSAAGITRDPCRTRALGVGGGVLAAVAVWVVAVPLLGVHVLVRFGSGASETVGVDYVIGATLIASLAGWACSRCSNGGRLVLGRSGPSSQSSCCSSRSAFRSPSRPQQRRKSSLR